MKEQFIEKALRQCAQLKPALKAIAVKSMPLRHALSAQLSLIQATQEKLEALNKRYPLTSPEGQIAAQKTVYPELKSLKLYCQERYTLLREAPTTGLKDLKKYYLAELAYIDRFFHRHQFHYGYYCLKAEELDPLFFTLTQQADSPLLPVLPGEVPEGMTLTSYLFARFMAYERLRADLKSLMSQTEQTANTQLSSTSVGPGGKLRRPMQWTGETVHLIELAHALHLKGSINNGEMGILEFFEGLGDFFGVNLGVPKAGFDDLRARKRISKTHFTEQLRGALLEKMADEDKWDKTKSLARRPL